MTLRKYKEDEEFPEWKLEERMKVKKKENK